MKRQVRASMPLGDTIRDRHMPNIFTSKSFMAVDTHRSDQGCCEQRGGGRSPLLKAL